MQRANTIRRTITGSVLIGYSGKSLGNLDARFGRGAEVEKNQKILFDWAKAKKKVVIDAQGGTNFIDLNGLKVNTGQNNFKCDGIITNKKDISIALFPADCIPLVIYSTQKPLLALIHIGRKNAENGIHALAVKHLITKYICTLESLRFYFGPSVKQKSYSFKDIEEKQKEDPRWKPHIKYERNNYFIDLVGFTKDGLKKLGVSAQQITASSLDIGANKNYFSHIRSVRTGEPEGRNGFIAKLI